MFNPRDIIEWKTVINGTIFTLNVTCVGVDHGDRVRVEEPWVVEGTPDMASEFQEPSSRKRIRANPIFESYITEKQAGGHLW